MEFKPPDYISLQGNVAENWRNWKQMFDNFLIAKEAHKKKDMIKIAMLLTCIGPEALDRYNNFTYEEDEDKKKYSVVVKKFATHFSGLKRTVFSRYQFWTHPRGESQPFQEYLTNLQTMAKACDFTEGENMVRDKVVFSTKEKPLKERLLHEENLTLKRAIDLCIAFETTQNEVRSMAAAGASSSVSTDKTVHQFHKQKFKQSKLPVPKKQNTPSYTTQTENNYKQNNNQKPCGRCGYKHGPRQCKAYNKRCTRCNGRNHFASMCRSKSVHTVSTDQNNSDSDDEFWIGSVAKCLAMETTPRKNPKAWFVNVKVCKSQIKMKIDTGAETNTIPIKTWRKIAGKPQLTKSAVLLRAFGDSIIDQEGMAKIPIQVGSKKVDTEVFVTKGKTVPIIGLQTSTQLGLIMPGENQAYMDMSAMTLENNSNKQPVTVQSITEEYKDVFNGLGCFPGHYHIELKEDAQPVIHPPKRVPPVLLKPLKNKLMTMEQTGVIESVDYATDWVHNIVIAEKKNSDLRICLDPRSLNKNIKRPRFQIPTFEDIVTKLGGKHLFTILDQASA